MRNWPWWNIFNSAIALAALSLASWQAYDSWSSSRSTNLVVSIEKTEHVCCNFWHLVIQNIGSAPAHDVVIQLENDQSYFVSNHIQKIEKSNILPIPTIPAGGYFRFTESYFRLEGGRADFLIVWRDSDHRSIRQSLSL